MMQLKQLKISPYSSEINLKEDKEYFFKKMNWNEEDLNNYISRPAKSHSLYPNSKFIYENLLKIYKLIKPSV